MHVGLRMRRQVEIYDPRANAWRSAAAMAAPRAYGAAAGVDGAVYALGGMRSQVRACSPSQSCRAPLYCLRALSLPAQALTRPLRTVCAPDHACTAA